MYSTEIAHNFPSTYSKISRLSVGNSGLQSLGWFRRPQTRISAAAQNLRDLGAGLGISRISTGSGDVIAIWGALKGEKVLIRRGLEGFFSDDSKRDLFGNSLLLSGGWQYDPFLLAKNPIFLAEAITFPLDKLFLTYCSICSFHNKLILSVQIEIVGAESRLHPWAVSPSLCPPRWRHPGDPRRLKGQNLGRFQTTGKPLFGHKNPPKNGSFASNI